MNAISSTEPHCSAVVVGGGQAGLSSSYWLSRAGLDHVVFEKKTAMHKRRSERWDGHCHTNLFYRSLLASGPVPDLTIPTSQSGSLLRDSISTV